MKGEVRKMKRNYKRLCAGLQAFLLVLTMLYITPAPVRVNAETVKLSNPKVVEDATMKAGQKVTWDCITLGSYPQSEVTSGDAVYEQLVAADGWDENQEIIIDGKKYRRMLKGDATYTPRYNATCYYQWEDAETYHYFLYEPIKWRVLNVEDNKALLLSDIVLDNQKLYSFRSSSVWDQSQVRSWLNGYGADANEDKVDYANRNFIDTAFTGEEQSAIIQYSAEDIENAYLGSGMEDDTTDKLFLLSATEVYYNEEAENYGFVRDDSVYDEARWCKGSDYAKAQGIYIGNSTNYEENCCWWLRKGISNSKSTAGMVYDSGIVISSSYYYSPNVGVRVAMNLDLSAGSGYEYAGTICSDAYKQPVESVGEKIEGVICNPRTEADNSAAAEQKTTWDCVWFGSYPQREVTGEEAVYSKLEAETNWGEDGNITIDGVKYCRILQSDSRTKTPNTTNPESLTDYYWSDDTTYHYFQYEPIKWRVLSTESGKALLLADKVLDYQYFGKTSSYDNVVWKDSDVRNLLNGYTNQYRYHNFLRDAFTEDEEGAIFNTFLAENYNLYYDQYNSYDTTDKVFILSDADVYGTQEARQYGFGAAFTVEDRGRIGEITPFAKAMGGATDAAGNSPWWLRSAGSENVYATYVWRAGNVDFGGAYVKSATGIRPALYMNLNRTSVYAYAGETCSDGTEREVVYSGIEAESGAVRNPVIVQDASMKAGQNVTWDCITFGSYPQSEVTEGDSVYTTLADREWDADNEVTVEGVRYRRIQNEASCRYFRYEPIKWRVLRVDNHQALLLSDVALDSRSYSGASWDSSLMRSWLNGYDASYNSVKKDYTSDNFINAAFSMEEQGCILPYNESDACDGAEEEDAITDKLFLLSTKELCDGLKARKHGFVDGRVDKTIDEAKRCHVSDYAVAQGVFPVSSSVYQNNCIWWVRGNKSNNDTNNNTIWTVADNGCLIEHTPNKSDVAVRVALNLDLSAKDLYAYAGRVSSKDNIEKIANSPEKEGEALANPRMISDYSTASGKKTTWDCIWYGSYPQSEVLSTANEYTVLSAADDWDENGDITLDNKKYRRLTDKQTGAYRYFRYEPVKWRVLKVEDDKLLLLADEALDLFGMDITYASSTWDLSSMRSWLNGKDATQNRSGKDFTDNNFIGAAFSKEEQTYIANSKVDNKLGMYCCMDSSIKDPGKNTMDKLFLLADFEVYGTETAKSYGFDGSFVVYDEARRCQGSDYVSAKGLSVYTESGYEGNVSWWLRTQGKSSSYVPNVKEYGYVDVNGVTGGCGVRPAMYLKLDNNDLYSYAGVVCSDGTQQEVGGTGDEEDNGGGSGSGGTGEDDDNGGGSGNGGIGEDDNKGGTGELPGDDNKGEVGEDIEDENNGETGEDDSKQETTGESESDGKKENTSETGTGKIHISKVSIEQIPAQIYCTKSIEPVLKVLYNKESLKLNQDYKVAYRNNVNAGKASVTVTGIGKYKGTRQMYFNILPFDMSKMSKTLKGRDGKIYRAVYKNKAVKIKTAFRIASTCNGGTVYLEPQQGKDYSYSYINNKKIGTAGIVFRFRGNYKGTLTKVFEIVPPATNIVTVKKRKNGIYLKWKKVNTCDRYEIYRSATKKGTYKKIATVKGRTKCTYVDKKAKKGKKYYYKVKACKYQGGKLYKSDDSNIRKGYR